MTGEEYLEATPIIHATIEDLREARGFLLGCPSKEHDPHRFHMVSGIGVAIEMLRVVVSRQHDKDWEEAVTKEATKRARKAERNG